MVSNAALDLATDVLTRAVLLDSRLNTNDDVVEAWASCFDGKKVFPEEAVAAVDHHYSQPSPFQIMPGDVLGYCAGLPPYSSVEHANYFLDFWAQHPYSSTIETHTGMRAPEPPEFPNGTDFDTEKKLRTGHLRKWVHENRDELVAAIMSRRFDGFQE